MKNIKNFIINEGSGYPLTDYSLETILSALTLLYRNPDTDKSYKQEVKSLYAKLYAYAKQNKYDNILSNSAYGNGNIEKTE